MTTIKLSEITEAFDLPRPDWDVIYSWIAENIDEDQRSEAVSEAVRQWLGALNESLGPGYHVEQSEHVLMLAPRAHEYASRLLREGESALEVIGELLPGVVETRQEVPYVAMLLANDETFHRYVLPLLSPGQQGRMGGIFFPWGFPHIVLCPLVPEELQSALFHELAHACLVHLDLPLWLDEGVAEKIPRDLTKCGRFEPTSERMLLTKAHWQKHGLQDFWWGAGFGQVGEGQEASYDLARVLVHQVSCDHVEGFPRFVLDAHAADAGDAAAQAHLGKAVAEIAAQFLGPGDWAPVPQDAAGFRRRADLRVALGHAEGALEDYAAAIRANPADPEILAARDSIHHGAGRYELAMSDYEAALDLDPDDEDALNSLAWLLATCPVDACRDARAAIAHAQRVCELSRYQTWNHVGTLAAAYAEAGDFDEALRWAGESGQLAPPEAQDGCRERLASYSQKQPFRDLPQATPGSESAEPEDGPEE